MSSKFAPHPGAFRGVSFESNDMFSGPPATIFRPVGRASTALVVPPREDRARHRQSVEAVRARRIRVGDQWLVSFVSASYLGLEQDVRVKRAVCRALDSWGFSLAIPRRLARDRITAQLEHAIAGFVCQPAALVFPSTTHAALDLLPALATPSGAIFVDVRAYPTSLEGVHAAERRGARVYWIRHNDPSALQTALRAGVRARHKIVVCAGVYPEGAEAAPLREYADLASTFGAFLYIDDSHGIGIFGKGPATAHYPYGRGSGGLTRFLRLQPGRVVVGGTLGKATGVPIAFVAGPTPLMDYVESVCLAGFELHAVY
jgi:8-amino-7-oxononanoate synthase